MSALITADWHLSDLPRDAYRHVMIAKLPALAKQQQARQAIVLGDLTELKDRHSAALVNQVVGHVAALAKVVEAVYVSRGNHDYVDINNPYYAFLKHIPNVRWINQPSGVKLEGIGRCLFLPHTTNHERDWDEFDFEMHRYVLAHNTFEGAVGDNGRRLDGVPLSVFPKGVRVISGDVHVPQKLGPVTYVGAPYTIDFGDDYEPRALLLAAKGFESLPLSGPQKRLLEAPCDAPADGINPGDIVKVRVSIDREDMERWAEIRDKWRAWGSKRGFIIHTVEPLLTTHVPGSPKASRRKASKRDDGELLDAFGKASGVDDRTMRLGHKLM